MTLQSQDNKQDPKNKRTHTRIELKEPLNVKIASIGGSIQYDLVTKDVSYYGFFLGFDEPARFPFQSSSILEIRLELPTKEIVFFNGKIARVVFPGLEGDKPATVPGIAIRIVQMDKLHEKMFENFIHSVAPNIEKKTRSIA